MRPKTFRSGGPPQGDPTPAGPRGGSVAAAHGDTCEDRAETRRLWVGEGQDGQLLRPGAASTGPSLTLAAAAGRCPAATEPAQRRPAAPVRRGGGGQARKHPGGAEAPTRTPPPASELPAAPTDSIDWTPANTDVYAAACGLGDPEVVLVWCDGGSDGNASWGRSF